MIKQKRKYKIPKFKIHTHKQIKHNPKLTQKNYKVYIYIYIYNHKTKKEAFNAKNDQFL